MTANHDQVLIPGGSGSRGQAMGADDLETIALIQPTGPEISRPDIEIDVRRRLELRVIQGSP